VKTVFRSVEEAAGRFGPCALSIGNFDGVHLGHRTLIRQTQHVAQRNGWKTGVLTFDPHPTAIVAPERAPQMICSLQERVRQLEAVGAEQILILPFTERTAAMSAEEFVRKIAVEALESRAIVVGQNFKFGHKQCGNTKVMAELGQRFGFESHFLAPITTRGEVISSSAIRKHLSEGRVARAARLLGRYFSMEGDIIAGQGIGSKQTVPTLNILPGEEIVPKNGVYITQTEDLENGRRWQSITNVGVRPTFGGEGLTIETFLLSPFDGQAPERICLHFRHWVREERKFADPSALRTQILKDVERASAYWRRVGRITPPLERIKLRPSAERDCDKSR
jgi:riboflavin kinase / FMN adenylyltransferase